MIRTRRAAAPAARFGLGLLLLLPCVLLQPASGFVAAPSRLAPPRPASSLRSTTTTMSAVPGDMEPGGLGSRQARRQGRFNKPKQPEGKWWLCLGCWCVGLID